jgi:hypothetical protein
MNLSSVGDFAVLLTASLAGSGESFSVSAVMKSKLCLDSIH